MKLNYELKVKYNLYKFKDEITILKGLEFGEPHLYREEFEYMKSQDFDVILASVHWINDKFVGQDELLDPYTKKDLFKKYYEIMMEIVVMGGFDVLAHINFPIIVVCIVLREVVCFNENFRVLVDPAIYICKEGENWIGFTMKSSKLELIMRILEKLKLMMIRCRN